MDPVIIGLLCGAVGLFTGVASMLAFRASERSRTVDLTVGEPETLRSNFVHAVKTMPCSIRG